MSSLICSIWLRESKFLAYALATFATFTYFISQSGLIRIFVSRDDFEQFNAEFMALSMSLCDERWYLYKRTHKVGITKFNSSHRLVQLGVLSLGVLIFFTLFCS